MMSMLATAMQGQSPDVEGLMTRHYPTCQDITYNVQFLIPEYVNKASADTLDAILTYWEIHCGQSEALTRCRILLAIDRGNFSENLYDQSIMADLNSYKNMVNARANGFMGKEGRYWRYANFLTDRLDQFTVQWAIKLLQRKSVPPLEMFFLRIYSNNFDSAFEMLQSPSFNGTKLQQYYALQKKRQRMSYSFISELLAGAWIPQENLTLVGVHPQIGYRLGLEVNRFDAGLILGLKFLNSPNEFQVLKNDSVWNTRHFFGGVLGLDMGYDLIRFGKNHLKVLGGMAYDGFDVLSENSSNSDTKITKTLNSLNVNVGLGYAWQFNQANCVGIECKYNLVHYKNTGATDLSGNVWTVNLVYRFSGNNQSGMRASRLRY